jgi:probable HAF family extracellular repeat protein
MRTDTADPAFVIHASHAASGRRARWHAAALIAAGLLASGCADQSTEPALVPASPPGESASSHAAAPPRYEIRDLQPDLAAAGFDGAFSAAFDISNAGRVAGAGTIPGGVQHGFLWQGGQVTNTGSLGGDALNSQAGGRTGNNALAILSETADVDPLAENFCGFGTPYVCRAAVWDNGVMTELPTLGGNNAAALSMNSAGQVDGLAEDGVLDNSCILPQKSHFQAVVWEHGQVHKLPPLPGDEVAMASRNNANGQVVGTSGLCSNTFYGGFGTGPHAVLWDRGVPTYLGTLGAEGVGFAAAVNNKGEVFGAASYPGGSTHAFRWTRGTGMQDLGLMSSDPADAQNTPFQANDRGQMVGASCDVPLGNCRGYLWQNGSFFDINALIPQNSNLFVALPFGINASGQIAGLAIDLKTGEPHAFLATPVPGTRVERAVAATRPTSHSMMPAMPAQLRTMLRR